jgi:hypothetical protein
MNDQARTPPELSSASTSALAYCVRNDALLAGVTTKVALLRVIQNATYAREDMMEVILRARALLKTFPPIACEIDDTLAAIALEKQP